MNKISNEEALKHVLDGSAVLITGSGASWGATNTSDEKFPSGYKLATLLYNKCSLPAGNDLRDATDTFLEKNSKVALIAEIKRVLQVKTVQSWHKTVFSKEWRTIYTTNYDEIPILSAESTGRRLTPITLDMNFRKYIAEKNKCIFINGYIGALNDHTIDTQFKLNSNSYLSSDNIYNSQWGALLNEDIESSKAIIIIGLSLEYDLDLERILSSSGSVKEKTILITSKPSAADSEHSKKIRKLARFGKVYEIGIEGFAEALEITAKSYLPTKFTPETYPFSCFDYKYRKPIISSEPTSDEVFAFYVYGMSCENMFYGLGCESGAVIARYLVGEMFDYVLKSVKILFLHSYFGNGKTGVIEQLKHKILNEDIQVFELKNSYYSIVNKEIDIIISIKGKKIIIIEDFSKSISVLKKFSLCSCEDITFILTARTGLIDAVALEVQNMFNTKSGEEYIFDANLLNYKELLACSSIFERYGYWGIHSRKPIRDKIKLLRNRKDGNSALQSILLFALESDGITTKLSSIIDEIRNHSEEYFKVLVLALTSRVMNLGLNVQDINSSMSVNTMRDLNFKTNSAVRELILLDNNEFGFRVKSSVVANKILESTANAATIVDVLYTLAKYASMYYKNQKYYNILREIISYSLVSSFIERFKDKSFFVLSYYEKLSTLQYYTRNHFFWLQYAMACLEIGKYDRTQKYLDTAYGLSSVDRDFVPFQINNQQAKLLLTIIEAGASRDIKNDFLKAHNLLKLPIVSKKDNPLIVIDLFRFYLRSSFQEKFMHDNLKSVFKECCADAYNVVSNLCKTMNQDKREQYASLQKKLLRLRFS